MTATEHQAGKRLSLRQRRRRWSRTLVDRNAQGMMSKEQRWQNPRRQRRLFRIRFALSTLILILCGGGAYAAWSHLQSGPTETRRIEFPRALATLEAMFPEALPERSRVEADGTTLRMRVLVPEHMMLGAASSEDPVKRLAGPFVGEEPALSGAEIAKRIERMMLMRALPITGKCYTHSEGGQQMVSIGDGRRIRVRELLIRVEPEC